MDRQDVPERQLFCIKCVKPLSELELIMIGVRCVCCANPLKRSISLFRLLKHRRRQARIYDLKIKLRAKLDFDAVHIFFAVLGNAGVTNENELTPTKQVQVIRELEKEVKKNV